MRLNKFMAACGVASRRKCDEIIAEKRVKINGNTVTKLGVDVGKLDTVTLDDKPIFVDENFVYLMLNKPVGFITSVSDPQGRKTVMQLLPKLESRVFPVGRLDYDTSGLLLFTNDGDLAQKLMHPKNEFGKTYIATVNGCVTKSDLQKLRNGVDIGNFVTSRASAEILNCQKGKTEVKLTIHEGKNRQVRRMFESLGKKVEKLQRVFLGKLGLYGLPVGKVRKLTKDEINYLQNL